VEKKGVNQLKLDFFPVTHAFSKVRGLFYLEPFSPTRVESLFGENVDVTVDWLPSLKSQSC